MNNEVVFGQPAALASSRKGSPFAAGTAKPSAPAASVWRRWTAPRAAIGQESPGDGVWQETAASAAFAALMLIVFCSLAAYSFPAGGLTVGMLGIGMSLFGLSSRFKRLSIVCLVTHACLAGFCYIEIL